MNQDPLGIISDQGLIQLGLNLPIEDVARICEISNDLRNLCDQEDFWRQRLDQDFPSFGHITRGFAPPPYITFHQLYSKLWQMRPLSKFLHEIEDDDLDTDRPFYLIFPVPSESKFELDLEQHLKPDVKIIPFVANRKKVILVAYQKRKDILGNIIPVIGEGDITSKDLFTGESPAKNEFDNFIKSNTDGFSDYFLMANSARPRRRLVDRARIAGYKWFDPNHRFDYDKDIFAYRFKTEAKPSNPKLQGSLSAQVSPPVQRRNRSKNLFGFLSS